MTLEVVTPNGKMQQATYTRRVAASLTDVLLIAVAASTITFIAGYFFTISPTIASLIALCMFSYYLAHPYFFKKPTPGQWALGLNKFKYSELTDYSGKGSIWCVENLPKSTYSKRTLIIASIFIAFHLIFWSYAKYTGT